jgi:hypothetical protein
MGNTLMGVINLFRPIKQLNRLVNRARLFCAWETTYELLVSAATYSFFAITNQLMLCHILFGSCLISVTANYITSITHPMRFIYSGYINIISIICVFFLTIILLGRLLSIAQICNLFLNFLSRQPQTTQPDYLISCLHQRLYYVIWFLVNLLSITMKALAIYFSFKAHNLVKIAALREKKNQKYE